MEVFTFKILNPTSRFLRRSFGNSVNYLFDENMVPIQFPLFSQQNSQQKKKFSNNENEIQPLSSFVDRDQKKISNVDSMNVTPVKKPRKVYDKTVIENKYTDTRISWLKPRDINSYNSSRRFWNSLEVGLKPIIKEKRVDTPDLWKSYTSTPAPKSKSPKNLVQSCDIPFYKEMHSFTTYCSIENTMRYNSIEHTPQYNSFENTPIYSRNDSEIYRRNEYVSVTEGERIVFYPQNNECEIISDNQDRKIFKARRKV